LLKIKQAETYRPGDPVQRRVFKYEIQKYLHDVYESQVQDSMKDVYITDHKLKA